mmetsp:Transcript_93895/g.265672  ORF Transcript_93895/g.265672 Transcript_93895/m.265672 type:complete len:235 (-) Transcript_93895:532-1236(-)
MAPLTARIACQSTCSAVSSSAWASQDLTQAPASTSQNWSFPSRVPATARIVSQCTDMTRTADAPPEPKLRTSSPSSRLHSLRPPSLEPESAYRSRGSRVPQTRCTVTPSAGTPWSWSVESLGIVSAHHMSCCEEGGTPRLVASCSFRALMRMVGSAAMRARLQPRMLRTVTWKLPSGGPKPPEGSSRITAGELVGAVETLLREGFSTPPRAGMSEVMLGTSSWAASRNRAAMKE